MKTKMFALFLLFLTIIYGCKKKKTDDVEPASKKLDKVWTVQSTTENGTLVYTRGANGNVRDYSLYKLDLSNSPNVILTEVDGKTFNGQYEITSGETKLTLTNLNPAPTGTGGTIEFTIKSNATVLVLEQIKANLKTGNSKNILTLTNP